jgi:hypothetical protein
MKNIIFIALMLAVLTAVAHAGLFSYWNFNEGSGTIAHDSAGSHNGTLVNGPTWITGILGGALSFDGANDYVKLSPPFVFNANHGTIALWFKTSGDFSGNYGSQGNLLCGIEKYFDYLAVTGNGTAPYGIYGETNDNSDYIVGVANVAPVGIWNHLAISCKNQTAKTYLNGNLIDTRGVGNPYLQVNYIGGLGLGGQFFKGEIDDVRIYDNDLSQADIRAIMPEPATVLLLGLGAVMLRKCKK